MKVKKTVSPRRRVSFAVDRQEIEVNSDWVEAVMTSPRRPAAEPFPDALPIVSVAVQSQEVPIRSDLPLAATAEAPGPQNTATGAESTSDEECSSVEINAPVVKEASVVESVPVGIIATVGGLLGIDLLPDPHNPRRSTPAPVVDTATGERGATGEGLIQRGQRVLRPRPIVRVTDGLTPGQYAVYSLMYEAGEIAVQSLRIYRGGYADLRRLTGLSKRGIQNIIGELQSKQVIRIHQKPGYHRTETSAYEVPDAQTVIGIWSANGWRHSLGKSKVLTG
jgi:hypothetical protein